MRDGEPAGEQTKWRREEERGGKEGRDWFLRRDESVKDKGLSKYNSISSKNERKPLEEKNGKVDAEAEASYSYRAPYQDDFEGVKNNTEEIFTNDVENSIQNPNYQDKIPVL